MIAVCSTAGVAEWRLHLHILVRACLAEITFLAPPTAPIKLLMTSVVSYVGYFGPFQAGESSVLFPITLLRFCVHCSNPLL